MLTPQEVSSHAFTKGFMGGYNMAMVDEFLDELTDDYTALYKENAALKAKMKVLVEKVEEYRATEDSMRATLLTAQKMADSIVREAEAKRDSLMVQAETDARERIAQIRRELETEEERLRQGQRELARFIAATREVCNKELQFLEELPQLPVEMTAPPPAAEPPVQEIEEKVISTYAEQPPAETPAAEEPAPEPPVTESPKIIRMPMPAIPVEMPPAAKAEYPEGDPFAREEPAAPVEATRRIKFDKLDDLKFGPNYTGGT